ncbi:MAG: hypothetical protein JXO22_00680 [Phycisphaerae bacterium]|nr:hypothetical protein [Phycisphaerae bacterium]
MESTPLYIAANEFGLKRVVFSSWLNARVLLNDKTRHGMQSVDAALASEPMAYYHRGGPLGDVFAAWTPARSGARVAIIGLGVGCMAAYATPGQHLVFYEIDPAVAKIAADTQYFTYLSTCRGTHEIIIGDACETLPAAGDGEFDMIVIDAFDGDDIPPALVDAGAMQLYLSKLTDAGLLVFHITSIHVALQPVLAGMAVGHGLTCLACSDLEVTDDERAAGKLGSHYVVMARDMTVIAGLAENGRWARA